MIIGNKYTIPYAVASSSVDGKCRCTPMSFVTLAQDLAALHYSSAGLSIPHLQQKNLTWIISRQHFEIYEYPLWLDELIVQTWAHKPKGLQCFREFQYRYACGGKKASIEAAMAEQASKNSFEPHNTDGQNGQNRHKDEKSLHDILNSKDGICMSANSCWLVLNTETGRLVPPDDSIMGTLGFSEDSSCGSTIKVALNDSWDTQSEFAPSLLDIDLNSHVNNLNYIRWILSFMSADFCRGKLLKTLDTNFVASARYGENLICRCAQTEDNVCMHSIVRSDGTEVFRARSEWADEQNLSRELKIR